MASVAMLSPPIKKESDVLTRTSLLPKRKPVVSSVTTRARFVKPRPNVSVNKALKESLPAPAENEKTDNNVPSQPIETESEPLQRSVIPKRTPTIPAAPRSRFQRARPNIGLLVNKSAKENHLPEERSTSDDLKTQQISDSKVDVPDDSVIESISDKKRDSDCKSPPVSSLLNIEKSAVTSFSVSESQPSPQPIVDPIDGDHQEFSSVRTTLPQDKTLESRGEDSSHSDLPIQEPESEISSASDTERSFMSPRPHFENPQEKDSPTASVIVNKNTEYPTLKSILNSPRKRTATKKVHERRKRVANFSSTPSRSEMTMVDLIYWNPSSSPMKEIKPTAPAVEDLLPVDDPPSKPEEAENNNIGPKVIINDDGEIILDESSLFVRRKDTVDHSVAAVVENDNTTYSSFRNRSFKTWSKRETAKFYKALSLVGTDFALMENIFKEDGKITRTRRELKLKFKREEKSNPKFVHTAMYELQTYDLNILDEDHDIELLDESELIDDAPKQAKTSLSGTKTPGKRGRKKKSELTEAIINENTSESILEIEDESRETVDSMSNGDLVVNKNDTESNSKPVASRPERIRKAKDLADYVTDVDDLSDTNDYLDSEGETLPIKKRKTAQILSEEDDGSIETSENNGLITGDYNNFQEKETNEENICHLITNEADASLNGRNDGKHSLPIKKKRKYQTLPENNEENIETSNPFSDLMPETSRSGRKIKAKKMLDFITDPGALSDSDAESTDAVEIIGQLSKSTQLEEEFSIIPTAEANGEYPGEQNVICTLDVETPNVNNPVVEAPHEMDQNKSNNPEISVVETISPTEVLSAAISSGHSSAIQSQIDNFVKPVSENFNDVDGNNIITDSVVTEVVVTSDQVPRRTRRKILPNVIKGSMRPPIQKKPVLPSRRTSFTSFTPVEEEMPKEPPPKVNFVTPLKTYSKPTDSKLIKSEKQDDMPEYLETVQKSPVNILRKRSRSGPAKSPSTPEMGISRTNSMCTPTRSPLTNAPLNVFSFNSDNKPNMQHSSIEMPLNSLTADPRTINMNPENLSDSPPVVLFTRTPNNSNMLHLFLYQKS